MLLLTFTATLVAGGDKKQVKKEEGQVNTLAFLIGFSI